MRKDAIRDPKLQPTGPVLMDSAVWVCGVVCGVGMQGNRSPSSLQRFPVLGSAALRAAQVSLALNPDDQLPRPIVPLPEDGKDPLPEATQASLPSRSS